MSNESRATFFTLRSTLTILAAGLLLALPAWLSFSSGITRGRFLPHGVCYTWDARLIALHVVSDALIGVAYFSIPVAILHLTRKRKDLPFSWIFLLFGLFIVACGGTHLMEVWTLWFPDYWAAGAVKALTAGASVPTAVALVYLMPKALALPSRAELERAKAALEAEVRERRRVEEELRAMQQSLEQRVIERTEELQKTNEALASQREVLAEADKAKDEFISIMSHELRNPLGAISNAVLVISELATTPEVRNTASLLSRQVYQMRRLLNDLLDVSRINRGLVELDRRVEDVRDRVRDALEANAHVVKAASQCLHVDMPEHPLHALIDGSRITQIISNLIDNAAKYAGPGAEINVELRNSGSAVTVVVRDNGRGFPASDAARLFDRFRSHRGGRNSGLGLGLWISRSLAEMHGGTLGGTSGGEGKGATFTLVVPGAPSKGKQTAPAS